ncbi:elongation factor P [Candidatus Fermentibacteria bacterium]|nr:elongation factor P [Candidatus Fermentibacteria bacterium]
MTTSNDFRKGMIIEYDGDLYEIVDFLHVKPGKGSAFVRSKLKGVFSGKVINKNWRAGEKVEEVRLERRTFELLYRKPGEFVVMDPQTFEQITLSEETMDEAGRYLVDNSELIIVFRGERPVMVEPPMFVELEVRQTEPGVKGDTASGGSKPAVMETGLEVQVPLFVREGDRVKIDTRTDSYIERASS